MCEWCGHDHPVSALCTKRPTWGRRGFLALMGATAVGAVVPLPTWAKQWAEPEDLPYHGAGNWLIYVPNGSQVVTDAGLADALAAAKEINGIGVARHAPGGYAWKW